MGEAKKIITDFTGGEVSNRLMARVDSPLYPRTCRTAENFIVHASGGADFRPGTYYCGEVADGATVVRLIPFARSATEAYVLELSDYLLRIWYDGALVESGGSALEIVTPWAEADLFELKYAQTDDAIYFSHPDYQVRKVVRASDGAWDLRDASYSFLLAVAHLTSPYFTVYGYETDSFEKKTNPGTLPPNNSRGADFSPNGQYLVVSSSTNTAVTVYRRTTADTFEKLDDPAQLPAGITSWVSWSPDSVYVAISHATTPYVTIYKRSGDTLTKLDNPAALPVGDGLSVAFSPNGTYLAVGHATTPYVTIYKRSGDTFTKLDNPASLPTGSGSGCAWSQDSSLLAISCSIGPAPYFCVYRRSGDTFTKMTSPTSLPPNTCTDVAFSPSGIFLAVCCVASPYILVYKRYGDTFVKLDDPDDLPPDAALGATWSLYSDYLAVSCSSSPYVLIYSVAGDVFTKIADPATLPTGSATQVAFTEDGWRRVPWGAEYPSALIFHEQRLVAARGKKIWASSIGKTQDFTQDAEDESAGYAYEFASELLENVVWMTTKHHNIILGTTFGEWLMSGGNSPITASNVYIERVSAHGSANIAALPANESVLFVQKGGQRLREFMYSEERGGYISPDLTLLADHIGAEGFKELEWQRSPRSILWTVRDSGELASLTLDRNHDIAAWARHPMTNGEVESVAVIPGPTEDVVYMVVKRTIGAGVVRYIEYLTAINRPDDEDDHFFVDCGLTFDYSDTSADIEGATQAEPVVITATGHPFENDEYVRITGVIGMTELNDEVYVVQNKTADTFELFDADEVVAIDGSEFGLYIGGGTCQKVVKTIMGLDHLIDETVAVCADGEELGNEVVSNKDGSITIDEWSVKIHVGLQIPGALEPQLLGQFSQVRIPEGVLLLYKTRGGEIGAHEDNMLAIRYPEDEVVTGPQEVRIGGVFDRRGRIRIEQNNPYPMTVLGLVAKMEVDG